jgi:uncharacterized membrane protein
MTKTDQLIRTALASIIAVGLAGTGTQALADKGDHEKCAGIAKAGKNDCGTSKSSCAGTVKTDRDPEAWVLVPKGTCEKIAGGTVTDKSWNKPGGKSAQN